MAAYNRYSRYDCIRSGQLESVLQKVCVGYDNRPVDKRELMGSMENMVTPQLEALRAKPRYGAWQRNRFTPQYQEFVDEMSVIYGPKDPSREEGEAAAQMESDLEDLFMVTFDRKNE